MTPQGQQVYETPGARAILYKASLPMACMTVHRGCHATGRVTSKANGARSWCSREKRWSGATIRVPLATGTKAASPSCRFWDGEKPWA